MKLFNRLLGKEERSDGENIVDNGALKAFLNNEVLNKDIAMGIPAIASAVNLISSVAANVNYKLYSYNSEGKLIEEDDYRVNILNKNTGDLLNGYEMKKAFVRDYLLEGNGFIYKNTEGNRIVSLHYVAKKNVSVIKNYDPIFKKAIFMVNERQLYPYNFITIARNTDDGVTGKGLLQENNLVIKVINNMLNMLNANTASGGVKKGFLKSQRKMEESAFNKLKADFEQMYSNTNTKAIILNNGVEWQPANETSTEMQLQELYDGVSEDAGEILQVPENIKNGKASDEEYRNWFKNCIIPILTEVTAALNETMLLEYEKNNYFWKADTSELENGDIKNMFEAYEVALRSNIMQLDEAREKFGLPPVGFNYIKLGLDTVLIDTEKGTIYTPNTNMMQDMNDISNTIDNNSNNKGSD